MAIEREVRAKIEAVLNGTTILEELCGSTSVRGAVGLVFGVQEGVTQLTVSQVWDYLDPENVRMVRQLQREYGERVRQAGFPGP